MSRVGVLPRPWPESYTADIRNPTEQVNSVRHERIWALVAFGGGCQHVGSWGDSDTGFTAVVNKRLVFQEVRRRSPWQSNCLISNGRVIHARYVRNGREYASSSPNPGARARPDATVSKPKWQKFVVPAVVVLLAAAVLLTITWDWNYGRAGESTKPRMMPMSTVISRAKHQGGGIVRDVSSPTIKR